MTRKFEQTELTKVVLAALKSFANEGRWLQSHPSDQVMSSKKLLKMIEADNLDVRFVSRED